MNINRNHYIQMSLSHVSFNFECNNPISKGNYSNNDEIISTIIPFGVKDGIHAPKIKKCLNVNTESYKIKSIEFGVDIPQYEFQASLKIALFTCNVNTLTEEYEKYISNEYWIRSFIATDKNNIFILDQNIINNKLHGFMNISCNIGIYLAVIIKGRDILKYKDNIKLHINYIIELYKYDLDDITNDDSIHSFNQKFKLKE
jgi:hypothetical protein